MVLLVALSSFAALVSAGILYQQLGLRQDRRHHPPLGRIVSVRTGHKAQPTRLHLLQCGNGSPAVMLEAGIAGSLLGWSLVQDRLADFTAALSYDRAGLGWSSRPRQARTVEHMILELHELLNEAKVKRPLVLAGHSFGGLLVRAYAHRWPEEVAGLVLVDPVGHSNWANTPASERKRLRRGALLSRRGAWLADLGVVRGALHLLVSGRRRLPLLVSKATAGRGAPVLASLLGDVRHLPSWSHAKIQAHWSDGRCFRAMADYLEALPGCASTAVDLSVEPSIPVTILSARTAKPDELEERQDWVAASRYGQHILVPDSTHWIQIHKPDIVIDAIRQMVENLRSDKPVKATEEPST